MSYSDSLTMERILEIFEEEASSHQGKVLESFNHGGTLFARSVLPQFEEIRVGDRLQSGVALRATQNALWVYPYVFRLVCRNGAIMARAAEGQEIAELGILPAFEAETLLRETIAACCQTEVFAATAEQMRSAAQRPFDLMLSMMPMLARLSKVDSQIARQVLQRFVGDDDKTDYGFINAVTSTARDTQAHELRWKLEEFAGELILRTNPAPALEHRAELELPQSTF